MKINATEMNTYLTHARKIAKMDAVSLISRPPPETAAKPRHNVITSLVNNPGAVSDCQFASL